MPKEFFNHHEDFAKCDLLIVMGTSLKVQPFGSIVNKVKDDCPRLLINNELVGDWIDYEEDPDSNYRDVVIKGFCDESCMKLAKELGWDNDLKNLIEKDKQRLC
jgi:NAD-dependent deacetylase sirtuin 2